jgi:hypothetical protein
MKQCTCGGTEIYVKLVATYQQFYDLSGQPTAATEPMTIRGGTMAYCADCGRRLGPPNNRGNSEAEFMRLIGAMPLPLSFEEAA